MPTQKRWSLDELRHETGLGRAVMRSFVRDGLLPHPGFGPGSGYDLTNRLRLLSIVKLRDQGFSGAALKSKLATDDEAHKQPSIEITAPSSVSTWLHLELMPGVELNIDLSRADGVKTAAMLKTLGLKTK